MEKIETQTMEITLVEEGFAIAIVKPNSRLTLETELENSDAAQKLGKGKPIRFLIDSKGIKSATKEARQHFAKSEDTAKIFVAVAILVGSGISRMIGNFLVGFNKLPVPAKLFTEKEKAIEWLKTQEPSQT